MLPVPGVVPSPITSEMIPYGLAVMPVSQVKPVIWKCQADSTDTDASSIAHDCNTSQTPTSLVKDTTELDTLFAIVQNENLTLAQKNMRFACQLKRTQPASFKCIQLLNEFTTNQLTLAMGSANDGLLADNAAVEKNSLPFCVVDRTDASFESDTHRIAFNKIILPKALHKELNEDPKIKERAGVREVTTLQDWACGVIRSFKVQVPDFLPSLSAESHSLVTFVPVKEEQIGTHKPVKSGQWDPFFKGTAGPKVVLTYVNDNENEHAQNGASGIVSQNNKYVVIQDSTKKKHHWSIQSDSADLSFEHTVAKIKRTAVNFVIIPIKPITLQGNDSIKYIPSTRIAVDQTSVVRSGEKAGIREPSQQTYKTTSVHGLHKVDTEGTIHVQVRAIPIDIRAIKTKTDLEQYVQDLGKMALELAEVKPIEIEPMKKAITEKQQVMPVEKAASTTTPSLSSSSIGTLLQKTYEATSSRRKKREVKKPEFIKQLEELYSYVKDQFFSLFMRNQGS